MALTPQRGDLTAGLAGSWAEDVNAPPELLITGDVPAISHTDENVAASQTLAALTVVGFDGSGRLIPAVLGTTPAIGVLVYAITTGVGETDKYVGVYRSGVFNPRLLVWDATYGTDLQKAKAFEGAPSPTRIIIRAPRTLTV